VEEVGVAMDDILEIRGDLIGLTAEVATIRQNTQAWEPAMIEARTMRNCFDELTGKVDVLMSVVADLQSRVEEIEKQRSLRCNSLL